MPEAVDRPAFASLEVGHGSLEHVAVAVGVAAVIVAWALALRHGVVVVEFGVDVHRGGAQIRRQGAARCQVAAGVHRARGPLHRSFERPA
jgi:hypothetical protein